MILARPAALLTLACAASAWSVAAAQSPPLTLQAALAALPTSPQWLTADLTYESARLALASARASAGLRVTVGGNYSLSKNLSTSAEATQSASLSANLSTTVLPWGTALDEVASAERSLARAALDRTDSRNNLAISLVSEYHAARLAAVDLAVANASRDLAEAQHAVAVAQRANGAITAEALMNAARARDNAIANAENATRALEIARLSLGGSLGKAVGDAELSSEASVPALPGESLDSLVLAAASRRSDVKKAELQVQAAEAALGNARRDRFFPDSSLGLQYSAAGAPSLSSNLNLKTGSLGASLSYPVLGGNSGSAGTSGSTIGLSASLSLPIIAPASDIRIASAEASLASARAALDATRRAAELDVRQKYADARSAVARVAIAQSSLRSAEAALATAQARLAAGTATRLDVQSAQVSLLQAQRDLASTTANAAVAVYRLQNALGTLTLAPQEAQP